ncbi:SAM-dependent methyltransferase [Streptomyces sp. 184]|uniref:SAM-dependent methyltransferase n=1 Tax=Streptomyces sp. 184 TaxID=1827526 RepID=UPI0038913266
MPKNTTDASGASDAGDATDASDAAVFWDGVYAARGPAAAAPRPNVRLVETVADLPPGDALDLGCGSGGDALWLARRGWRVTAVDISAVAADRVGDLARSLGLGERVSAARHDLGETFPEGRYDLIAAHYLHTPYGLDRSAVLRTAAGRLRPGGRLLVVDHGSTAPWSWNQDPDVRHPPPREVAAGIGLDPATWAVERADAPRRTATGPGGRTAEVTDHVLLIRRLPTARRD